MDTNLAYAMAKIMKIRNVGDYSRYVGHTDRHPLVSVIDYAEVSPVRHSLNNYSVYGIFFHDEAEIDLAYGCGKYDYKKGTVICVAPGQIGGKEDNGEQVMLTGWALLFHPDLLHATHLEKAIKNYSFFDYRVNEALHMTDEEHDIFVLLMRQIRDELQKRPDELQNAIIVGYIELMLNFCQRFYNRQFITRKLENSDILMKFDSLLRDYYEEKTQLTLGIPTVQYCADKLCMSPNYFGDMIKKNDRRYGEQLHSSICYPTGEKRLCNRGVHRTGGGRTRIRISPASQPDVQKTGRTLPERILRKTSEKDPGQRTRRICDAGVRHSVS